MSRTYPSVLLVSATVILMILASRSQILSNAGTQSADQPAPRDNQELIGLYRVDSGVTDGLTSELDVPSLEEAKAREAQFNQEQ